MARERYLVGVGQEDLQVEAPPELTPKEKWKNWWHYHKIHVAVALVLLAAAMYWVYTAFLLPKPDYSIGMITSFNIPEEVQSDLQDYIAQYADDRNGDGRVLVEINSYIFGDAASSVDYDAAQAAFARFSGNAALGTDMIFFNELAALEAIGDSVGRLFQYNDGSPMPEGAQDYDNAMRPWEDYAGLAGFTSSGSELSGWTTEVVSELCSRLNVAVRTPVGSSFENDEKQMAYYEDSLKLLERLEKDEKLEKGEP